MNGASVVSDRRITSRLSDSPPAGELLSSDLRWWQCLRGKFLDGVVLPAGSLFLEFRDVLFMVFDHPFACRRGRIPGQKA